MTHRAVGPLEQRPVGRRIRYSRWPRRRASRRWRRPVTFALAALLAIAGDLVGVWPVVPAQADTDLAQGQTLAAGTVARSRGDQGANVADNAFDGNDATAWQQVGGSTFPDGQLCVDVGPGHTVTGWRLLFNATSGSATISIQGSAGPLTLSNDCTVPAGTLGWTVIENRTGFSGDSGVVAIAPAATYRYYRVGVSSQAGGCGLCINTFSIFGGTGAFAVDAGTSHPDSFGQGVTGSAFSPDPVNLATGSSTAHAADLALPGRVLPLSFTRWYNSADNSAGSPLGPGWTHSFNWLLTDSTATVIVRRGDGRQDTFTKNADGSYADPPGVFDTLVKNLDGSFTLTAPNQIQYELSSAGQVTRIHEPAGNQLTLAYIAGSLASITDTVGRVVSLAYTAQGLLAQFQDPLGRTVTYAYDGSGRLVTVTDKLGNTAGQTPSQHQWRYGYDGPTRHITTITDPDGRVRVTNTYDTQGRVTQQRDALSALTTIAYSAGQTVLTDPRGHSTTYTFDSRMRVLSQSDPVGAATYTIAYTYDPAGNRTSVTDRNGNRTDFSYDARGNLLTKTDPSPDGIAPRPVTTFAYDVRNNLTRLTDAMGFSTTFVYDSTTNVLLSVARQLDAATAVTTRYDYADPANPGLPTRLTSPRGNTGALPDPTYATTLGYDAQGNLVRRSDPDGAITTFGYDSVGRLTSFVDPDGNAPGAVAADHTWRVSYDAVDREVARTDPLTNAIRTTYDGAGNRTAVTDRNGNVTTYGYDPNARLATVQQRPDPFATPTLVYTTQVARDANGNAVRVTQANTAATDYGFDALNRLATVSTHPTATTTLTTSYTLDGNGQPMSRTTGDGVTVAYRYDALSRLVSVSGPALAIAYTYDPVGRRTRMTDSTGVTSYSYDGLGRVTSLAGPSATLGYGYDLDGNRTRLGYSATDAVTYAYSPGGRLTSVTDWAARVSRYSYQPSGLVSGLSYPNGLTASSSYDRTQRLTSLTYALGGTVGSERYTLDPEGNRTALSDLFGTTPEIAGTLGYDGLNRLTAMERHVVANGAPVSNETFTLDPASNVASRTDPTQTFSYDGANRVTSDGTRAFVWDGADRLTARGSDYFSYDPLSRLTAATVAGTTRTYGYDGDGLLRSRTQGTTSTAFLYDSSIAPAPLLQAGTERLVYGLGPLYQVHPNGRYDTLVRDGLGSVRLTVSGTGAITAGFDYTAYGAPSAGSFGTSILAYAGELRDPSGLIYLRARWYDPGTGRFMSRDEVPGSPQYPVSRNSYAYASGNPTLLTDPSGNCPWCIAAAVGAVIGGSASLAGYLAVSGDSRNLRDAVVAFGGGAVSGAVCVATAFAACAAATTAASVAQYGLSTGEKTPAGYAIAGAIGLASAPFVFTPYKIPSSGVSLAVYSLTRPGAVGNWESGRLRSFLSSFGRSFLTSIAAGLAGQAFGADGSDIISATAEAPQNK